MKTIEEYEREIVMYHDAIKIDPDNIEEYQNKLEYRLNKWFDLLDIQIFVASNEQKPWLSEELGFPTKPMLLKSDISFNQVADYQCYIERSGRLEDNFASFIVDRKTCSDFYGTLFGNRLRFYKELDKFDKDPRFTDFYIFVECDLLTWLNYRPPNSPPDPMINAKMGVLASLETRGAHVVWCGSRKVACRMYRDFVKQYCLKNYTRILKLDETKDNNKAVKYFDND